MKKEFQGMCTKMMRLSQLLAVCLNYEKTCHLTYTLFWRKEIFLPILIHFPQAIMVVSTGVCRYVSPITRVNYWFTYLFTMHNQVATKEGKKKKRHLKVTAHALKWLEFRTEVIITSYKGSWKNFQDAG